MKLKTILPAVILLTALQGTAQTKDFFDTSAPDRLMTLGVRLGVNTSNRSMGSYFNFYNNTAWGVGADLGMVADLNLRNYISIQPGVFLQVRKSTHSFVNLDYRQGTAETPDLYVNVGKRKSVDLAIPIVASVKFNVTDDLRWNVDFGPYLGIRLGGSGDDVTVGSAPSYMTEMNPKGAEFGFKMGTGLMYREHYSFNMHYWGGCTSAWKAPYPGHTKMWTFTLGYDF